MRSPLLLSVLALAACSGGEARQTAASEFDTFLPPAVTEWRCYFFRADNVFDPADTDTHKVVFVNDLRNPDNHARITYGGETLTLYSRNPIDTSTPSGTIDFQVEDYPGTTVLMDLVAGEAVPESRDFTGTLRIKGTDARVDFKGSCRG